jgi:hypothetical protein
VTTIEPPSSSSSSSSSSSPPPPVPRAGRLVGFVALAALAGCSIPPRGYYVPEGVPYEDSLVPYNERSADAILDARCQGVYVNSVDGRDVLTVHVQLDVERIRSGDLVVPRDAVSVALEPPEGGPAIEVPLAEAWSRREPLPGDLVVPSWSLRPFDLFFDSEELADAEIIPETVLLQWSARAGAHMLVGEARYGRIPDDDPRSPSGKAAADKAFGMYNGYYLPGKVALGERELQPSREERLHYIFHEPRSFWW